MMNSANAARAAEVACPETGRECPMCAKSALLIKDILDAYETARRLTGTDATFAEFRNGMAEIEALLGGALSGFGLAPKGPAKPGPEDLERLGELRSQLSEVEAKKEEFDREERAKLQGIEEEAGEKLQEYKDEMSRKSQADKGFAQEERRLKREIGKVESPGQGVGEGEINEAMANTLKEAEKKADRSSETTNTPSSQQGYSRPAPKGGEPGAKRGAKAGHAGYEPTVNGKPLSQLTDADLRGLERAGAVEVIDCMPGDVPPGASLSLKGTRCGFEVRLAPVLVYCRRYEAVWRDPENKRKLVKKAGSYPDWLRKSGSYGPQAVALAPFLRHQGHMTTHGIQRFFREVLGLPVSAQTVHTWCARAARNHGEEITEMIKGELKKSHTLHMDETSVRENGGLRWVYVSTDGRNTLLTPSDRRDFEGVVLNGVAPEAEEGTVLVRDGYAIYNDGRLSHLLPARCWAHKVREGKKAIKFDPREAGPVLEALGWFDVAMAARREALDAGLDRIPEKELARLTESFDGIVEKGLRESARTKAVFGRRTRKATIGKWMGRILSEGEAYLGFMDGAEPGGPRGPGPNSQARRTRRP